MLRCRWEFTVRKKRCCRGCSTLLLIPSYPFSDEDLTALKSFWMWDPLKETWNHIRDWEEHKQEASRKFEEFSKGLSSPLPEDLQERSRIRPRTTTIQ